MTGAPGTDSPTVVDEISRLLEQCSEEELTSIIASLEDAPAVVAEAGALESAGLPDAAMSEEAPASSGAAPAAAATDEAELKAALRQKFIAAADNGELGDMLVATRTPGDEATSTDLASAKAALQDTLMSAADDGRLEKVLSSLGLQASEAEQVDAGATAELPPLVAQAKAPAPEAAAAPPPPPPPQEPMSPLSTKTLASVIGSRDIEVRLLEAELEELHAILADRDARVEALGEEVNNAVRQVRHRQLDLEYHHLKLEDRIRANTELESSKQALTMEIDRLQLEQRHAEIDLDSSRGSELLRIQGSLPWALRAGRKIPISS